MSGQSPQVPVPSVDYEDVLAARVVRKTLGAMGVVVMFVLAIVGYAGFRLESMRQTMEAKLQDAERRAEGLQASLENKVSQAQRLVLEAQGLIGQASSLVQAGQSYQGAVAGQLSQVARLDEQVKATRIRAEDAIEKSTAKTSELEHLHSNYQRMISAESLAVAQLRQKVDLTVADAQRQVGTITDRLFNLWHVVVPEDRTIPIGNSGISIWFDDVKENRLTRVRIMEGGKDLMSYESLQKDFEVKLQTAGNEYRMRVLEATTDRRFLSVKASALVSLERIPRQTASTGT